MFHDIDFILDYCYNYCGVPRLYNMKACFIGHRKIIKTDKLLYLLKETILQLINVGVTTFIFGSKSEFNDLSWEVVTMLKNEYPSIKRVYVRNNNQYINDFYEKYLLTRYEETYYPPKLENAGKYSYVKRNYDLIDNSEYCIFYYNKNYTVSHNKQQNDFILTPTSKSGTKIAYNYAISKRKNIINLYNS